VSALRDPYRTWRRCQELYWGKRLAAVVVDLKRAKPFLVKDLLTDAWIRKAPATLVKELTDR
jgi:hypothetical protein